MVERNVGLVTCLRGDALNYFEIMSDKEHGEYKQKLKREDGITI